MYGQRFGGGGWILGRKVEGTQAEHVRVPFADTSTHPVPAGVSDEQLLMAADILVTGYELGVLNVNVGPGDFVCDEGGRVDLTAPRQAEQRLRRIRVDETGGDRRVLDPQLLEVEGGRSQERAVR
jgi:hypothetical protein